MSNGINLSNSLDLSFLTKCDLSNGPCEKALQVRQSFDQQLRTQAAVAKQLEESKSAFQKFADYGLSKSIVFAAGAIFNGYTGGSPFAGSLFFLVPSVFADWTNPTSMASFDEVIAVKPIITGLIGKVAAIFATYACLIYTNQEVSNSSLIASLIVGGALPALAQLSTREFAIKAMENQHRELHYSALETDSPGLQDYPEELLDKILQTPGLNEELKIKFEEITKNNDLGSAEKFKKILFLLNNNFMRPDKEFTAEKIV